MRFCISLCIQFLHILIQTNRPLTIPHGFHKVGMITHMWEYWCTHGSICRQSGDNWGSQLIEQLLVARNLFLETTKSCEV